MSRALALALAACLGGCGGDMFTVSVFPDAGAGVDGASWVDANTARVSVPDAPASTGPQSPNDGPRFGERDSSDDAGASMRDAGTVDPPPDAGSTPPPHDAGPPPACEPQSCAVCPLAQGYACCTAAGACGCENPSQGGACL